MILSVKARVEVEGKQKAFEGGIDEVIAQIDSYLASKK